MHATNYFENAMLNIFRGTAITAPAKVYVALRTEDPTDAGTAGAEISYSGYARQEITFSAPAADQNGGMYIENAAQIGFPEAPASGGTAKYIALMDALTGGNMLLYAPLSNSLAITAGIAPVFPIGSIHWTWSGLFSAAAKTAVMNTLRGTSMAGITPKIAFYNGDPAASGTEFSGSGYARLSVTFGAPAQDPETGDEVIKNTAPPFSASTTANTGTLTHIAVMDALTGGNVFAILPLPNSITVKKNQTVGFVAGQLKIRVN